MSLGTPGPAWMEEAPGQGQAAGVASEKAEKPALELKVAIGGCPLAGTVIRFEKG